MSEAHRVEDPQSLFEALRELRAHVVEAGERLYCEWRPGIERRAFRLGGATSRITWPSASGIFATFSSH